MAPVVVRISILMTVLASASAQTYTIPTSAMEPTLLIGDHILAPRVERVNELLRGDIIVFHFPPDPKVVLVKRLIGLPGDHLYLSNGDLILNAKRMTEDYVVHRAGKNVSPFLSNFPRHADEERLILPDARRMLERYAGSGELVIPKDGYFVMGDNRDDSYDSRSWGLLVGSDIIGLVREVLSSEDPKTHSSRPARIHLVIQRGNL